MRGLQKLWIRSRPYQVQYQVVYYLVGLILIEVLQFGLGKTTSPTLPGTVNVVLSTRYYYYY